MLQIFYFRTILKHAFQSRSVEKSIEIKTIIGVHFLCSKLMHLLLFTEFVKNFLNLENFLKLPYDTIYSYHWHRCSSFRLFIISYLFHSFSFNQKCKILSQLQNYRCLYSFEIQPPDIVHITLFHLNCFLKGAIILSVA